jgi:hypothetical protein
MAEDPQKKNSSSDEERENRKFDLRLIFIVIIGFSCIFFILKFRQAKQEISHLTEKPIVAKNSSPSQPRELKEKDLPRKPQAKRKALVPSDRKIRKKLIPAKRDKSFDPPEKRTQQKPLFQLGPDIQLGDEIVQVKGRSYSEVENVYAVSNERKDEFSAEEILYERGPYVIVKSEEGLPKDGKRLAYNHRTRRLAIITGQIILRFSENSAFENRGQHLVSGESEVATHNSIMTAVLRLEGAQSLEDLKKRESFWGSLPGIKAANVEVLEAEILLK